MKWTGTDGTSLDSVKWDGRTLAKQQQRKDTRFSSEEKRVDTSMVLNFLFTRTLSWDVAQSPAGLSLSAWRQSFQHHYSTSISPNIILWWQGNRRILLPATECHWSDTQEGHSWCTRGLECKGGPISIWTKKIFLKCRRGRIVKHSPPNPHTSEEKATSTAGTLRFALTH